MRGSTTIALLGILSLICSHRIVAEGKADGGVILRDGTPIYDDSKGNDVKFKASRHDGVGGTSGGFMARSFQFERKDGRLRVLYFDSEKRTRAKTGWVDEKDLATFSYECGCGYRDPRNPEEVCSPRQANGDWNTCFRDAKDKKVQELSGASGQSGVPAGGTAQKAMTNADVIALSKAQLGDDIIIAKIQGLTTSAFDTSADALIALKKEGVSKDVIAAMVKQANSASSIPKTP